MATAYDSSSTLGHTPGFLTGITPGTSTALVLRTNPASMAVYHPSTTPGLTSDITPGVTPHNTPGIPSSFHYQPGLRAGTRAPCFPSDFDRPTAPTKGKKRRWLKKAAQNTMIVVTAPLWLPLYCCCCCGCFYDWEEIFGW